MVLVVNGEVKIEYDRTKPLAGLQRRFLEKMDADMDGGFKIEGTHIDSPNKMQRVQFVSNHVVNAYFSEQDELIAAGCAYIANHTPELKQIRVDTTDTIHNISLIFDEELNNQVKVSFPSKPN